MKGLTSDGGIGLILLRLAWLDEAGFLVDFFGLGWFLGAMVVGLVKVKNFCERFGWFLKIDGLGMENVG